MNRLSVLALVLCTTAACSLTVPDLTSGFHRDAGTDAGAPESTAAVTSATFTVWPLGAAALLNPERGWVGWLGPDLVTGYDPPSVEFAKNNGDRLLTCFVDLSAYRTQALPTAFLNDLGVAFGKVRAVGMKCVLQFRYDDGNGNDATATLIGSHAAQLKPLIATNADVVAFALAGFVGAWGDWNSSKSGNSCDSNSGGTPCSTADPNRAAVHAALLDGFSALSSVQFRTPRDLMRWYPDVITADAGFTGSPQARTAAYNGCFLAGPTDTATFDGNPAVADLQRAYWRALSDVTPFGGRANTGCEKPFRTTCSDILREAAQYHLTWYDLGDAAPWQQGWADGGCLKEVQDRLGYRLQLSHLSHQSAAARGEHLTVTVALSNVGWSRVPSERRLRVVLQRDATVLSSDGDTDLRTLPPQAAADTTLQVGFTVPTDAPTGLYQVSLQIPDPAAPTVADYAIRFANLDDAAHQQRWAPATFRFSTGTTVDIR